MNRDTKYILFLFVFIFLIGSYLSGQTQEECKKLINEAVAEAKSQNHAESLETLSKIKSLAIEKKWYEIEFLATNNIGLNQYLLLDFGSALESYLEGYKLAVMHLSKEEEVISLNNIAVLYLREENYEKAEEYFLKALEISQDSNIKRKIVIHAINLSSIGIETENREKTEKYLAIIKSNIEQDSPYYLHYLIVQAEVYFMQNKLTEAKNLLLEILPQLQSNEMAENRQIVYLNLAKIEFTNKNYSSAIAFLKKVLSDPELTLEMKKDAWKNLTKVYAESRQYELSLEAKDSMVEVLQTINRLKNSKLFEVNKIKFELHNKEIELKKSMDKNESQKKFGLAIFCFLILASGSVFWAFHNRSIRLKQKHQIFENQQKITELELEKHRSDAILLEQQIKEQEALNLLSQEKLKNEIEQKNRQLAVKALSISSKNEILEEIISHLKLYKGLQENPNLMKLLKELKFHMKNDGGWEEFFTHFEEVNQGFVKNLKQKHPELTPNDLRFISYYYMNLTMKEIASLLNITPEACRKRKERIAQKMALPENVELFDYISNLR